MTPAIFGGGSSQKWLQVNVVTLLAVIVESKRRVIAKHGNYESLLSKCWFANSIHLRFPDGGTFQRDGGRVR